MSGIYIPDMEMPFSCGECKLVQRYRYSDECQYLHKKIAHNGRLKDCPLVEVPPHGELCDKDKLKEATKNTVIQNSRAEVYQIGKAIAMMIDQAPVVVEATK